MVNSYMTKKCKSIAHHIDRAESVMHSFVEPRIHQGELGAYIITPFILTDGRIILVNRGWIPRSKIDRTTRAETLVCFISNQLNH